MRYHIGVHYGHNSTVAVCREGEIIFCQSEERLSRLKNIIGVPVRTLRYVYENIASPEEIASCTLFQGTVLSYYYDRQINFAERALGTYLAQTGTEWPTAAELQRIDDVQALQLDREWNEGWGRLESSEDLRKQAMAYYASAIGLPIEKLSSVHHQDSHALAALPFLNNRKDCLIFSLDGEGDHLCGTINILQDGKFGRLDSIHRNYSLGHLYSATTGILGCVPVSMNIR